MGICTKEEHGSKDVQSIGMLKIWKKPNLLELLDKGAISHENNKL